MSTPSAIPRVDHWIGGQHHIQADTDLFDSCCPENGSSVCRAPMGNQQVIDAAVIAADRTFKEYRDSTPSERENWLLTAAALIEERSETLTEILIQEVGSPVTKAKREISASIGILRAAAGETRHVTGKTYPTDYPGRISLSFRSPLGVVAGMTPFNVPLIKSIKHAAMPLATGNTVVLLPSEETPWLVSEVARIFADAGFPGGAFNVVYGRGVEIGDFLTTHPLVKFVGFTGSQRVGRHVQQLCGQHGKRLTLELGGKNPLIVLRDADLSRAIPGCVVGSFFYQGQICMSSSRIYVEEPIYEAFVNQFVEATHQIHGGNLRDSQTMIGPIINKHQIARIKDHLDDALGKGARVLTGNQWNKNTLSPTILSDVNSSMAIFHEETFGPVTSLHCVSSAEDALDQANHSTFGLSGAIYTNQLNRALKFASRLETGMVHINATTIQEEPHVPFGGTKQSGFGREGSQASVEELTEWKWVTIQ